jgi:segregation and condensation protein A
MNEANSVQQPLPLAFVNGEAVIEQPQDLYIPPDALEVILETFEGPLDLLLYLIRKQKVDILSMPVADITRQYMEYVKRCDLNSLVNIC